MELYVFNKETGKTESISISTDSSDTGRFKGKNLLVLGDSIMYGSGIPEKIAELSGINVINSAVGGTRAGKHVYENFDALSFYNLAEAIANGDFSLQLEQASSIGNSKAVKPMTRLSEVDFSTLDYLLVSYLTNDFTGDNTLEDVQDFQSSKYALEYGINKILTAYPNIKIMLNSPIFRGDLGTAETGYSDGYTRKDGKKLIDFVDMMISVGEKKHVLVNDNYRNLTINKETFEYYLQLSEGDFVHPNKIVGCDLIASRIYGQMLANW